MHFANRIIACHPLSTAAQTLIMSTTLEMLLVRVHLNGSQNSLILRHDPIWLNDISVIFTFGQIEISLLHLVFDANSWQPWALSHLNLLLWETVNHVHPDRPTSTSPIVKMEATTHELFSLKSISSMLMLPASWSEIQAISNWTHAATHAPLARLKTRKNESYFFAMKLIMDMKSTPRHCIDSSTRAWDPHTTVRSARSCIRSRLVALRHLPAQAWLHFSSHGAQRTASTVRLFSSFKKHLKGWGHIIIYHHDIDDIQGFLQYWRCESNHGKRQCENHSHGAFVSSCKPKCGIDTVPVFGVRPHTKAQKSRCQKARWAIISCPRRRGDRMRLRDWMRQAAWQTECTTWIAFFRLDAFPGSEKQLMKT